MNRVFPTETLEADTLWFARQLAGMPDASIHLTKNIMNALADGNLEAYAFVVVQNGDEGVRRHHGEICPLNPAKVRRYGPVQRSGTRCV